MRIQNALLLFFISILIYSGTVVGQKTSPTTTGDKPSLDQIKLESITQFAPKGRAQDQRLVKFAPRERRQDEKSIKVEMVADILRHGKRSIPWLISQLEDETKTEERVFSFWYNTSVGDVALVILMHSFRNRAGKPTIAGFGWDEFLERDNSNQMGEEVLRNYIEKYGRVKIRARWQAMWDQNQHKIIWDAACRCFKLSS